MVDDSIYIGGKLGVPIGEDFREIHSNEALLLNRIRNFNKIVIMIQSEKVANIGGCSKIEKDCPFRKFLKSFQSVLISI